MEFNKKPETRESTPASFRTEIPPNYFQMPSRDITQVQSSGDIYRLRDSRGRELSQMSRGVFGDLRGHSSEFLVFQKGALYNICDSRGRNSVTELSGVCGEFRGVSGQHIIFEKNNMLQTYDRNFKRVGNPQRKLS